MTRLLRRALLAATAFLAATALPAAAQERVVNIYNWSDYIDPRCSTPSPARPASR